MHTTLFAALAVAAWLGWGLPAATAQQQDTSPSAPAGGASTQPQTSGTAAAGAATADPAKMQTYLQMRKFLQSQVVSTVPADLSKDRETIDRLLKSQSRQWMGTDEFIQFHKQVQTDPALRALAEAEMQRGAAAAGASGTAAPPAGGPARPAAPTPGASPQ